MNAHLRKGGQERFFGERVRWQCRIPIERLMALDKENAQDGDAGSSYENKDVDVVVESLHCVCLEHAGGCVQLDDADNAGACPEHADDDRVGQCACVHAQCVT